MCILPHNRKGFKRCIGGLNFKSELPNHITNSPGQKKKSINLWVKNSSHSLKVSCHRILFNNKGKKSIFTMENLVVTTITK